MFQEESSVAMAVNEIQRDFAEEIDTGKWKAKFEERKLLLKNSKKAMVIRRGHGTVGRPEWTKMVLFRPKWTILVLRMLKTARNEAALTKHREEPSMDQYQCRGKL